MVLDTVSSKGTPGEIKIYRDGEIIGSAPPPRMTPHQPGLRESLMATELTDASPEEMVLIGVVPETIEQGTTLSAPVQAAVDEIIKNRPRRTRTIGCDRRKSSRHLEIPNSGGCDARNGPGRMTHAS